MAANVHFKVYVFWAENDKPEVRRIHFEKHFLTKFSHLNCMIQDVCPDLKTKNYSVAWEDEDGDEIVLSSDAEMMTALEVWRGDVIKLFVYCKPGAQNKAVATVEDSKSLVIHHGVICDACDGRVVGFRYKCSVCDDYDLCSRCEAAGHHPEHNMTRISKPRSTRTQAVAVQDTQLQQPPANFRGMTRSTSLGLRLGMPALDVELALRDQETRFNM